MRYSEILSSLSGEKMTQLLIKCSVGALTVMVIAILSKSKVYYVAGLAPLFPTFALIAHIIVYADRGANDLRTTALFGIWSLIPYSAYLLTVYLLSAKCRLSMTLTAATAVWLVCATLLIFGWSRFYAQ